MKAEVQKLKEEIQREREITHFLFEQWHRPETPPHFPEPPFSDEVHFLFNDDDEGCCLLSVSPVNEEMNELAAEIAGEYEKLIAATESFCSILELKGWGGICWIGVAQ